VSTHYFRLIRRGDFQRQRYRLLERLLAGADASAPVKDWRAEAFRVIAAPLTEMPGIGAAALCAEQARVAAGSVFVATPVHYLAEMSSVRLPADGILSLRQSEAESLCADFNRVWHDAGVRLIAGRYADLLCAADRSITVTTHDPEDVLDRPIENYLPSGTAAARLRGLMSEIEMWLFEHPVNGDRTAGGAPAVNALWLWGSGPALTSLPRVVGWTAGDDVFFRAFAARAALPDGAGSGVIVAAAEPGTGLENSVADLACGRIERLQLSAVNRVFSVSARWRRRFWRRLKPWWEHFE
jgi:hypothetical protein